jgi:hypothetical protein
VIDNRAHRATSRDVTELWTKARRHLRFERLRGGYSMTQQPHYEQWFDAARDAAKALSNAEAAVRTLITARERVAKAQEPYSASFLGLTFLLARRRGITSAPILGSRDMA